MHTGFNTGDAPGSANSQSPDNIMDASQCLGDQKPSPVARAAEHYASQEQTPSVHITPDLSQEPSGLESSTHSGVPQVKQEPSLSISPKLSHAGWEDTQLESSGDKAEDFSVSDTESETSDKDDSDYIDDEITDSDTEDLATAENKRSQSNRVSDQASHNIQAVLSALEDQKKEIVKISEMHGIGEPGQKKLELLEKEITDARDAQKALKTSKGKPAKRRPPIKNVREYFARKHQDEDKRAARKEKKKRKGSAKGGVRKKRKTTATQKVNGTGAHAALQHKDRIFDSLNGIESVIAENSAPIMPGVNATTKKELMDHFKNSIPEGCDNRHTKTQKRDLGEAWAMFGFKAITAVGDRCLMKGMNFGLLDYQLVAVGYWMFRELGRTVPHGGILADAPGLGKTVISLAAIVGNPPYGELDKAFAKTTIVVVPNKDIVEQWYQEVMKHLRDPYTSYVLRYTRNMGFTLAQIGSNWIVITTYSQVTRELPKKAVIDQLKKKYGDGTDVFQEELRKKASGGLLNINYYRVILDEAHQIKNNDSRVKLACCMLKGKHHWALTGTPLSNSLEEIFPYLQLIGCKFTKSIRDFRKNYLVDKTNGAKLEALISMIMLRRTNQDTFLGHRVLPLPKAHAQDIKISLSVKEEAIYQVVHQYFERIINTMKRRGDPRLKGKIEKVRLARQLRLRQLTSHPFTIEKILQERFREDEILMLRRAENTTGVIPILDSLREGDSGEDGSNGLAKFTTGLNHIETSNGEAFGGIFDMERLFALAYNEAGIRGVTCELCKKATPPVQPVQSTDCKHVFCKGCLVKALASGTGTVPGPKVECPAKGCAENLGYGTEIETLVAIQKEAKENPNFMEPGRDINNARPTRKPCENGFFIATCLDGFSLPPSSKLTAALAVLSQWQNESPDDKIVAFTQFIMTGKLLGRMLESLGIKFAYYYASGFTDKQRSRSIETFKTNAECKVLIAGLGCGAQSLNLTVANRVLSIEPWWNKTRELQAFGRVHRMGQEKECYFVRIMTQKYIDSRIDEVQQTKQEIIDRVLQDDGHVPTVLTDEQLSQMLNPDDENPEALEREVDKAVQEADELDEGED